MLRQAVDIYATTSDMQQLCREFEDNFDFNYAFLERRDLPEVTLCAETSKIDLFWKSPSGFLGRTILLVPVGCMPKPREVDLKIGGRNYRLDPTCVEKCVVLQEGGIFTQGDCLISGRMANTVSDDWSKSTFNALSRLTKKRFRKMRSYYLGAEAKRLFEDGYRLTFQSSALHSSDLIQTN
jgi:hypothetical protein